MVYIIDDCEDLYLRLKKNEDSEETTLESSSDGLSWNTYSFSEYRLFNSLPDSDSQTGGYLDMVAANSLDDPSRSSPSTAGSRTSLSCIGSKL